MEEKLKESRDFLDKTVEELERKKEELWTKTTKASACIRVEIIDRELSRWGRIERRLKNKVFPWSCFVYRSWTPLWTILYGTLHNLLVVANSSETYRPYPPQELDIVATHRELSPTDCCGSTDVYHKERLISRVQWHLWISDGYITLEAEYPLAIESLFSPYVQANV